MDMFVIGRVIFHDKFLKSFNDFPGKRLSRHYGPDIVNQDMEPMPSNIFGNVWGQTWDSLLPLVAPYPKLLRQVIKLIWLLDWLSGHEYHQVGYNFITFRK